jgi:RNA polymerase sigma-70 factor (ECF subfamily)
MPDRRPDSRTEALLAQAGWVRALALSLVRRPSEAEDAAQGVWLAALEHPPPELLASPRAWLRAVLRNVVARTSRRSGLRLEAESRHERRPDAEAAGDVIQRAELHRKLVDHVMALEEPGRSTILMHYFDGLSLAAIARRLGMPEGTVRSRHHRAVEQLRARLGSQHADWRAVLLPLAVGAGAAPGAAAAAAKTAAEVLAMTWKAKLGVGVAALFAIVVATLVVTGRDLFGPSVPGAATGGGPAPSPADPAAAVSAKSSEAAGASRALKPGRFQESDKLVLRGRVRTADGSPLEDPRVVVVRYDLAEPVDGDASDNPSGFPRVPPVNPSGEFALELERSAPAFAILATARGCAPRDLTVWAERLEAPVDVVLDNGGVVEGTVQTTERAAVPNAKLSLRWSAGGLRLRREARSDGDGR